MLPALFLATLLATVYAVLRLHRQRNRLWLYLLAWLALTGALAHLQVFADFERTPPVLPLFIATALIAATVLATKLPRDIPLAWLIGYQSFRIPVELFLFLGFEAGFVPVQMTWEGRNWDVLTGLAAIPLAWLAARNGLPVWALRIWNIGGFALLLNIMSVAILSLPTPLRQFHNEPANVFVAQVPYVWLPAVLVPAAWFGHIAVFRRSTSGSPPSPAKR